MCEKVKETRRKRSSILDNEAISGYLFILPNTLGLLILYMIPIIVSLILAFFRWDGLSKATFIGIQNFKTLIGEPQFLHGLLNTFYYAVVTVPVGIIISVLLAVALNSPIKGKTIYRTIYFLPFMTLGVGAALIWKWLFNTEYGLINYMLKFIGLAPVEWLTDPKHILISIMIIGIWSSIGYNVIIFLSGLQAIPSVYYEAAKIDGAGKIKQFIHITLPLLTPSLFFVLVTSLLTATQIFDPVFIIAGNARGSLLLNSRTVVYGIYEDGFQNFRMGYASAQALVLFAIVLIVTYFQFKGQKKWVHY